MYYLIQWRPSGPVVDIYEGKSKKPLRGIITFDKLEGLCSITLEAKCFEDAMCKVLEMRIQPPRVAD